MGVLVGGYFLMSEVPLYPESAPPHYPCTFRPRAFSAHFLEIGTATEETGTSLPNNQRHHRTPHAPKDVLPFRRALGIGLL